MKYFISKNRKGTFLTILTFSDGDCRPDYVTNPYTNTCIRILEKAVTWSEAKTDCESTIEYLAVFETEEAAIWIVNLMKDKNNPDG